MDLTPLPTQPDPLAGRILAGGLRVLKRLGETSDGPLYRAEYSQPDPPVCIVFLRPLRHPPEPSPAWAPIPQRLDWVHRATRIRHPNVARVHEVNETPEGIAYAVVEALTGDRLSDILAERGALYLDEAVDLCLQAAAGLSAAHEAGIVHGNISPSTIVLAHGEDGRRPVKLIGFTLGALAAPSSGYACPERLDGRAPDELCDIFSLGAVLHHALTGAPPGAKLARGSIPKPVRAVLRRALAASPARRFQTITEFADALEQAAASPSRAGGIRIRRIAVVRATAASVVVVAGLWMGWGGQRVIGDAVREELETGTRPPARAIAARAPAPTNTVDVARVRPEPGKPSRPVPRQPEPRPPTPLPKPDAAAASRLVSKRPEPRPPAPPPKTSTARPGPAPAPAATRPETRVAPRKETSAPVPPAPPSTRAPADSTPPVALSPFRRAHPWAAMPGGRFYFRSSCSLALRATELLYFVTEAEARATGRARSPVPGCS